MKKFEMSSAAMLTQRLPELVTVREVSDLFRVSGQSVRNWIALGRLQAFKTSPGKNGAVRIPRSEVRRLLREMSTA